MIVWVWPWPLVEAALDRVPRAHVLGLLLQPDDLAGVGVAARARVGHRLVGPRVELLDPHDRPPHRRGRPASPVLRRRRRRPCRSRTRPAGRPRPLSAPMVGSSSTSSKEPRVKASTGEWLKRARSSALGVNTISGLRTSRAIWRRSRWKYWAEVVGLAAWMLSSAASVRKRSMRAEECSGPLALVAVGQEQGQPRGLAPLVLGGHQELVDDDLGAVDEVAELGLPHDQRVLVDDRVAVLEAERGVLGQQRVVEPQVGAALLAQLGRGGCAPGRSRSR